MKALTVEVVDAKEQGDSFNHPPLSLRELLLAADLLCYYEALKNVLKLRHAGDLAYAEQADFDGVGMSRPEQKRLHAEYIKLVGGSFCPPASSSFSSAGSSSFSSKNLEKEQQQQTVGFVGKIKRRFFGSTDSANSGEETPPRPATFAAVSLKSPSCAEMSSIGNRHSDTQHIIIRLERISLCKEVGSGEFGAVFQAAWHRDGGSGETIQVAVKRILPEKFVSQPSSFLQEATIMTRMQHENVIRLFGVVLDTKAVMLVSELAPCGSLLECLRSEKWRSSSALSVDVLCEFSAQIARGMRYLSGQRLIHRDLAARNVLVQSPAKVKISDFGLSRSLGHGEDYYRSKFNASMKLPIAWCAPECINFLRFTSASDVWAFGVCLWEMFSYGKTPWAEKTGSQILHAIDTQRAKLPRPEACPSEFYVLMLRCWEWAAEGRPSFEQICEHLPALLPQILITLSECRRRVARPGTNEELVAEPFLHFLKGEILVLLDKSTVYPGFWLGATKTGRVGLFRPEQTIAFLGSPNPSSSNNDETEFFHKKEEGEEQPKVNQKQQQNFDAGTAEESSRKKETMQIKKNFLPTFGKREKKTTTTTSGKKEQKGRGKKEELKSLISEPQGDLRHTCHVGADGRSFGLLNINNQHELSLPSVVSPKPSVLQPIGTLPSPMSNSTFSLAPPRPPKNFHQHSSAAENSMSKSCCINNSSSSSDDGSGGNRMDESYIFSSKPQPEVPQENSVPALPPKPPRFRPNHFASHFPLTTIKQQNDDKNNKEKSDDIERLKLSTSSSSSSSNNSSSLLALNSVNDDAERKGQTEKCKREEEDGLEKKYKKQLQREMFSENYENDLGAESSKSDDEKEDSEVEKKEKEVEEVEEEEEKEFLRPVSICIEQLDCSATKLATSLYSPPKHKKPQNRKEEECDEMLKILTGLHSNLVECSLSTLDDFTENRALLDGAKRRERDSAEKEAKIAKEAISSLSKCLPVEQSFSNVSAMSKEEFEKLVGEERRRASKQLERSELAAEATIAATKRRLLLSSSSSQKAWKARKEGGIGRDERNSGGGGGSEKEGEKAIKNGGSKGSGAFGELARSAKAPLKNWPPEADQAYKLIVECGNLLKGAELPARKMEPKNPQVLPPNKQIYNKTDGIDGLNSPKTVYMDDQRKIAPFLIFNPLKGNAAINGFLGGQQEEEEQQNQLEYLDTNLLQQRQQQQQEMDGERNEERQAKKGHFPVLDYNNINAHNQIIVEEHCKITGMSTAACRLHPVAPSRTFLDPAKRLPPPVPPKPSIKTKIQAVTKSCLLQQQQKQLDSTLTANE